MSMNYYKQKVAEWVSRESIEKGIGLELLWGFIFYLGFVLNAESADGPKSDYCGS